MCGRAHWPSLVFAVPVMILLLFLVVYQYGYVRVQSAVASIKDEQAVKAKSLKKYLSLISEKPLIEKQIASLKKERQAHSTKLIEGQTLSLSAATLQSIIKEIITSKGGSISSERVGKPEEYGKFKLISISIDAVLPDISVLNDILYSIETRTPYLVVKKLEMRLRSVKVPGEIMVKLDVSSLTSGK